MAATPATVFASAMNQIQGNTGGAVQALPASYLVGGRRRGFIATLTLATQVSGTVIGMGRLPIPCVLTDITVITDTSLATATIKFGDAGNGNSAIYAAATTLTATDTPTRVGKTATFGVPITSGFDCVTGLATTYASSSGYGALYEDIIMTTGVASLPASGNFAALFEYMID